MLEKAINHCEQAIGNIYMSKELLQDLNQLYCISNIETIRELIEEFEFRTLNDREYFNWSCRVFDVLRTL